MSHHHHLRSDFRPQESPLALYIKKAQRELRTAAVGKNNDAARAFRRLAAEIEDHPEPATYLALAADDWRASTHKQRSFIIGVIEAAARECA